MLKLPEMLYEKRQSRKEKTMGRNGRFKEKRLKQKLQGRMQAINLNRKYSSFGQLVIR